MKGKRTAIPRRDEKMLWGAAGGRCSFTGCDKRLFTGVEASDGPVIIGESAHIVADSDDGPRGASSLTAEERAKYDNLILLCEEHHKLVDGQPTTYTVEVLRRMKREHEATVQPPAPAQAPNVEHVDEVLLSTVMPVRNVPMRFYSAQCLLKTTKELRAAHRDRHNYGIPPAVVSAGRVYSFEDLRDSASSLEAWVQQGTVTPHYAVEFWEDPDQSRLYASMMRQVLNKLTGRVSLRLDVEHGRYYFPPMDDGSEREVEYEPLAQQTSTRKVAWQPTVKKTGEKKKYWEHLAVSLRFHRITDRDWVLTVRPERRFTRDGEVPLTPKGTGRRSTSRASRLYNSDVLEEANFWRSYLSERKRRITWKARHGEAAVVIEAKLLDGEIHWPGIPDDSRVVKNLQTPEDLFSFAELQGIDDDWNDDIDSEDDAGAADEDDGWEGAS